jgi:hypothetical protein
VRKRVSICHATKVRMIGKISGISGDGIQSARFAGFQWRFVSIR